MIDKEMAEKSELYLCKFFKKLTAKELKSIGLMGGWAVHLLLHELDKTHIGSRDIDIFFDSKKISLKTISEKLNVLGFLPHSTFRWVKYFNRLTGKELTVEESKKIAIHELVPIYFDVSSYIKIKHSMFLPELKEVLVKENKIVNWKGIKIMVPTIKAMVELKLKSVVERIDSFKRAKDLADLYALTETDYSVWETKNNERFKLKKIDRKIIENFKQNLEMFRLDGSLNNVSTTLAVNINQIIAVLEKF
ncbi:MAG: hypothetical protein ABH821_04145 [archaeon]